jgi:hypothetical protein
MAAFAATSRGGQIREGQHEYVKVLVSVGVGADTSIYVVGKTDANGTPSNGITDYICENVERDPVSMAGRILERGTFVKLKAG